jgi:threonine-phosphate decarboxylase
MNRPAVHGGDVWSAAAECALAPEQVLDFSANVNPRGLPELALRQLRADAADPGLLMRYPDPAAAELRAALSARLGIPREAIVVGAGAEALLAAALRAFGARHCLVPVPAFSEYARACAACGATLHPLRLDPAASFQLDVEEYCRLLRSGRSDTAIVNNPHNPSGALADASAMRRIVEAAARSGTRLLVDEAFIDYADRESVTGEAARTPGVVAVRSLTKFYGCPALRAGYAVATPGLVAAIAAVTPTWPVTLLALNALRVALGDEEYARATLAENAAERTRLAAGLAKLGVAACPSAANYLLLRLSAGAAPAALMRERLLREHHILVRNCDSYDGLEPGRYLRVAVRSAGGNDRLLRAFEDVLKG